MKIVIPSHLRPDKVKTTDVVSDAIICIPKSQYENYVEHNPNNEIVVHPNDIIGISKKRQWIVNYFGDVFMIDDDIKALRRTYLGQGEKKQQFSKREVKDILFDTYFMLKEQTNIKLWGFSKSPSPLHYNAAKPIYLSGFIQGGAFGIMKDDYINLLNAYLYRKTWIDKRFFFDFDRNNYNIGGCGDFRNNEVGLNSFKYIKKQFGTSISIDKKDKNTLKWRCKIPF